VPSHLSVSCDGVAERPRSGWFITDRGSLHYAAVARVTEGVRMRPRPVVRGGIRSS